MTSSRLAGGNGGSLPTCCVGAGRLVTRYQVVGSGNFWGSVVATTARSVLSGPYGPATISKPHHCWLPPSRNVLAMRTHFPGCSARDGAGLARHVLQCACHVFWMPPREQSVERHHIPHDSRFRSPPFKPRAPRLPMNQLRRHAKGYPPAPLASPVPVRSL